MSRIHRKVTIRAPFHLTMPFPRPPFPRHPTSLPAGLTNCPPPRMMAHFSACLTTLSAQPTHFPIRLVHTPTTKTPLPQGTSTGIHKDKKQEGVKGKEEEAEAGKGEQKGEEQKEEEQKREQKGERVTRKRRRKRKYH